MAELRKSDLLNKYNSSQAMLLSEDREKSYSANRLKEIASNFSYSNTYDVFLSHSYEDARIVRQIKEMLTSFGYIVYVDWIDDNQLDRQHVSSYTAGIIRSRMRKCKSIIYLTSPKAEKSVWMPWELGFMDAQSGRVGVASILDDDDDFDGREYLGLYPYLDLTGSNFYLHKSRREWVTFSQWMQGYDPIYH
jgi:hypothetical protein